MNKLLALAAVLALGACASMDEPVAGPAADEGPGAEVAASLGYHGPVERAPAPALVSRNTTP